jgi:hypothetical protein
MKLLIKVHTRMPYKKAYVLEWYFSSLVKSCFSLVSSELSFTAVSHQPYQLVPFDLQKELKL